MNSKICNKCGLDKPLSDYYAAKHGKQGRKAVCKVCIEKNVDRNKANQALKKWREENPVDRDAVNAYNRKHFEKNKEKERLRRKVWRLKQYNITLEQYEALAAKQEHKCAICNQAKPLSLDHDHACCPQKSTSCGKCIRGLLCSSCNTAVGHMGDSAQRLRDAATYLELDNLTFVH